MTPASPGGRSTTERSSRVPFMSRDTCLVVMVTCGNKQQLGEKETKMYFSSFTNFDFPHKNDNKTQAHVSRIGF